MSEERKGTRSEQNSGSASIWLTVVLSLFILGAAAVVTYMIYSSEPQAQRSGAVRETAMLVEVGRAQRGDYRPVITGLRPLTNPVFSAGLCFVFYYLLCCEWI